MSNEDKTVQNQKRKRNAEEGSSREVNVAVDNDGYDINLNMTPKNV